MRCDELIGQLELLAPISYACDWDNPGLLIGRSDKKVEKVLVALDISDEVTDQAIEGKADFLLTHHPLIFQPLKKINDQNFISNRIIRLLQADISCYAMHTNFDAAPGCMADLAAARMGLEVPEVLEVMGESEKGVYGIGKVGRLPEPMGLKALAEKVKEAFGLPFVTVYGMQQDEEPLSRVAMVPGSGKNSIPEALIQKAQVLITGDIGYHEGIDAVARGLKVIDAGHYGLEHIFMDFMAAYLETELKSGLTVVKAKLQFPAVVL